MDRGAFFIQGSLVLIDSRFSRVMLVELYVTASVMNNNSKIIRTILRLSSCQLLLALAYSTAAAVADEVDFTTQVQPLLTNHCLRCHGPDEKGGLRLDTQQALLKGGFSGPVIVANSATESPLIELVVGDSTEPPLMPPPDEGDPLSPAEVETLRNWINAGAPWPSTIAQIELPDLRQQHWAFQEFSRPDLPDASATHSHNEIDHFVLARLSAENIAPSPSADRVTLLRRATLDLLGTPPSPNDIERYLQDTSPDAYERALDRLFASPHFGERWARHWLDGACYADSEGFETDHFRSVWRYRDWVIAALNQDLGFDHFVIEQVAGDMLPNATLSQKIATGFYRHNRGNSAHEPSRLQGVIDRVNVTGTVFMALTIGCAQCHSHKFDPISQREFYQVFAFFNNSVDPQIEVDISEYEVDRNRFEAKFLQLQAQYQAYHRQFESEYEQWLAALTDEDLAQLPEEIRQTIELPLQERSPEQQMKLLDKVGRNNKQFFLLKQNLNAVAAHREKIATALVLEERETPRTTNVFVRGVISNPGPEVQPAFPRALPAFPTEGQPNRLNFAQWLVSPTHPLTARVTVNRIWQQYFGLGLVETENDFGVQSPPPTHPLLLNFLAAQLRGEGWQIKRLHRRIVSSATYRQSSHLREDLVAVDPRNRLLARQRRLRLEAEVIRDQALAVSGTLNRRIGGLTVFPYQTQDVMDGRADKSPWLNETGASSLRRGIYMHFWRLTPHPYMKLFDVPTAAEPCTRRKRSNTPMQALALLNHSWFQQFSRAFAQRIVAEAGPTIERRIHFAMLTAVGRPPSPLEQQTLATLYDNIYQSMRHDISRAQMLTGDEDASAENCSELATWITIARTLLNLDEFITRE